MPERVRADMVQRSTTGGLADTLRRDTRRAERASRMVGTLRRQSWLFPAIGVLLALVWPVSESAGLQVVVATMFALLIVPVAVFAWRQRAITGQALIGLIVLALCSGAATILRRAAVDHSGLRLSSE